MTEFVRSLPTKTLTFSGDALEDVPVCTCRHVTSASACYSTCADVSSVQLNVNSLLHPYGDACKCVCVCVCSLPVYYPWPCLAGGGILPEVEQEGLREVVSRFLI